MSPSPYAWFSQRETTVPLVFHRPQPSSNVLKSSSYNKPPQDEIQTGRVASVNVVPSSVTTWQLHTLQQTVVQGDQS